MNAVPRRAALALVLLVYLSLAALFAVYTPAWQAPDEPAHYNYVRYLVEKSAFPVLHMGDYPHAYLEQIKAARFPADMSIAPIRYEFHQPPLYYASLAPVYALTQGSLVALRLVSVLLGTGIVLLAYAIGRRSWPARPAVALGAAAFVAFLPQHLATVSQVGNDVLAELLLAAALYLLVGWVHGTGDGGQGSGIRSRRAFLGMGVLLSFILITKTTAYIALPLAGAALIWRWWRDRASARQVLAQACLVILPAALIALPWVARNLSIYGWPDFLGLLRHDAIVAGQMRTLDFVAQNGWALYARRAIEWTFKSFVGVFGWMGVWMDSRVYLALAVLGGVAAGGRLWRMADGRRRMADGISRITTHQSRITHRASRLLALSALLTSLAYVWYNTQFLQHQGRYLFTALIPIALAFAAGWEHIVQPRRGRWAGAVLALAAAGCAAWGVLTGAGLPKWPVAILAAAAIGATLLDLALTLLSRPRREGHPSPERFFAAVRIAALVFPYAFLVIVSLYALFGAIVPQLS